MLNVKANFKNNYNENLLCPKCSSEVDTDDHLLSCTKYRSQPICKNLTKLLWRSGSTDEEIKAMSKTAKLITERQSERCESDSDERCQEEEDGASAEAC